MNIDEDTSAWLGCPTPLEMYKHHCSLLEDELTQTQAMLRKARANIAGLVQLCDELTTGKASAESALKKALDNIGTLNLENSGMDRKISSLAAVADQRDHLFRENQRLLMELNRRATGTPQPPQPTDAHSRPAVDAQPEALAP
ncbi:hypothetical protein [Pseudomonas cyclaminis]|uniref:hypothetical protein n=1 Tax=Pseudomonas cyclaminis TaxID=2781239 RepID=UPI003CC6CEFA